MKNSTKILTGILLIIIGIFIGLLDFIKEKKNKVFTDMNILLYESEMPNAIESEEELNEIKENLNIENPQSVESPNTEQPPQNRTQYDFIGTLEIPKINLRRGFLDLNSNYNNVNYNITVINGSTMPDKDNNNLILAAHSGVCSICFFHDLYKLQLGDEAYVTYGGIKYYYRVVNIYNVEKTGKVAIYRDYSKNVLTLITCTRNSNTEQTVYILELYNKENI